MMKISVLSQQHNWFMI